ncbi:MAG TPA: UDP-N-acetylmuramoyl-L-alanine--D-glutamate ligase [Anaeromyxobacteraceae bacterium]|nr:UDP-N-acetylmuramoyl-L-alanine--D-glutamate ligase [Anaeromyxobacteraceae bacterium]
MPDAPVLRNRKVTVVGLARSGVAAARLCAREGAAVTVTDRSPQAELAEPLAALDGLPIRKVLGGHDEGDFSGADLVVVSPGVPLSIAPIRAARARGVPVWGEVELAWRFLGDVPVVAISGTNGKSTTTALAGALFAEDRATFTGGNLGTPLSEQVLSGSPVDVVVAELSSFQIDGIDRFRPRVAAVLNVTPDHLDRYDGVEDYAAAKARLFATQQPRDFAVANARDPRTVAMAGTSRGELLTFGFGPAEPRAARAVETPDGHELWILRTPSESPERYLLRNRALRGRHNVENALAAVLCARLLGVPGDAAQRGLDAFPGLPHRLQLVRERRGVEWVNDSKATNVDSTTVALEAFPKGKARVIVLMGGLGKGAPYTPLRALFPGRVKALLTLGEDAPAVERDLGDLGPTESCGDLAKAVDRAAQLAEPGDVVLLSPACASYDQFDDYEHRGDVFRKLAEALP